jgi:hypothetical protein
VEEDDLPKYIYFQQTADEITEILLQ